MLIKGAIVGAVGIVAFGFTRNLEPPVIHWIAALAIAGVVAAIVFRGGE